MKALRPQAVAWLRPVLISLGTVAILLVVDLLAGQRVAILTASAVLIPLPLGDGLVVYFLHRAVQQAPELGVLVIHYEWAIVNLIKDVGLAIIGVNVLAGNHLLPPGVALYVLLGAIILPGVRSALWLLDYYRDKL